MRWHIWSVQTTVIKQNGIPTATRYIALFDIVTAWVVLYQVGQFKTEYGADRAAIFTVEDYFRIPAVAFHNFDKEQIIQVYTLS